MGARSEAERIYHDYFGSPEGEQRWEDAWLQFPEYGNGGGDTDNAADFIVEGMVAKHAGDHGDAWGEIQEILYENVIAGLT